MAQEQTRERWGSRIGVILAVAGSAVGLGNFLRFPGNAAQNGGGAFMLPYFISLLVLGIPLCWAEWTMGRYGGLRGFNSAPGIFSVLWRNRASKYFATLALLIPLVIYMYYVLIEAWCLGYALKYLTGDLMMGRDPDAYGNYLNNYVGADADGALFSGSNPSFLLILVVAFVLNFTLIYRGVTKGIEMFCRVAMPLMALLAIIVLVRVLTLGAPIDPDQNVVTGLGFMWNPRSDRLWDPQTWLAASGQIFFSLSVGFGVIINYASYLSEKDDVVLSGLTSSSMNEFFEVCLGGLITLPAAFIFLGPQVANFTGSSFAVGFVALPNVFASMPGGQIFGFLWFFMLFIAAITSSVSMLQPVIAFFEEGFGLKRHASVTILGLIVAMGCGFVAYFSKGTVALDTMDFWVGTFFIFILGLFQAIMYGWVLGIERGETEAHRGANVRIPRFVQYVLKYVTPLYLGIIAVLFAINNLPSKDSEVAKLPSSAHAMLAEGPIGSTLVDVMKNNEINFPAAGTIVEQGAGVWHVLSDNGSVLYKIKDETLYQHSAGQIEKVLSNPVAVSSMLFVFVVLGFLMVMVHIAGRRWEAEGRLSYGPESPTN
ncbi:MAG: sodium-dependent transporter [Planctomycetales bacterium]|nr:sodium-dependent transporter [Planctomycetales bacterium]